MKPINTETIAKSVVGWVYDFKSDNGRFPNSLDDLAENMAEKHSYNPTKALQLNQKLGFKTEYKLLDGGSFEVVVRGKGKTTQFSSVSGEYTAGEAG